MPRRLAAVACLALGLGLLGCGGSDDEGGQERTGAGPATTRAPAASPAEVARYRAQVATVVGQFAQAGQQLRDSAGAQITPAQGATAYRTFRDQVRATAGALARLRPPPGVTGPQRQLAAAFQAIAAASQPSIDAGEAGDGQRFQAARRTFQAKLNGSLGARARAAATRLDAGVASQ